MRFKKLKKTFTNVYYNYCMNHWPVISTRNTTIRENNKTLSGTQNAEQYNN